MESLIYNSGKYIQIVDDKNDDTLLQNNTHANANFQIDDLQTKLNNSLLNVRSNNSRVQAQETTLSDFLVLPSTASYGKPLQPSYKGPTVLGWPPEKNMSLENYILPNEESTFLILPRKTKIPNCTILIVVSSMPGKASGIIFSKHFYSQFPLEEAFSVGKIKSSIGTFQSKNSSKYKAKLKQPVAQTVLGRSQPARTGVVF